MNRGLFDLTNLESMNDNDIISMNINESTAEFSDREPDTNHPEDHFDKDTAAGSATNVSIPGGDKEAPTGVPSDVSIPVPGGDKETPTAKPYDAATVPASAKVTLTTDQYNDALTALKKSFKEGYEIMEMLENANVITESIENIQDEFVENAIITAFEDGPIFEAVKRGDKDEVKTIVRNIRPKIEEYFENNKIKFYKPNMIARFLTGIFIGTELATSFQHLWKNRLWQLIGIVLCEDGNIKDVTDTLTEKYKDDLGEYKILYVKTNKNIIDLFRTKFGWKNNVKAYFILVDKNIPKELKEVEEMVANTANKEEKSEETKND